VHYCSAKGIGLPVKLLLMKIKDNLNQSTRCNFEVMTVRRGVKVMKYNAVVEKKARLPEKTLCCCT
jgi:hypothetical protein